MEKDKKLKLIGKVHSTQGLRGHIFVLLKAENPPWIKKWKTLYLSSSENEETAKQEYEILQKREHSKQGKDGWVLLLKDVADKNTSDTLEKQFVWIPESFLTSQKGEKIFLREIENFLVVDKERGEVGPIVGFSSNGPQDLIQIQTGLGIYDVPLVEPFIKKIDYDAKKIHMDIPQGLLEDL